MDVGAFERCVRHLSKKYTVLSLEEACSKDCPTSPSKPIATISFDDGYHDNLEYAAPILLKYDCPASFYIVTDCIDHGHMVWTQEIKHYFSHTKSATFSADLSYLPQHLRTDGWKTRRQRLAYAQQVRNFLLKAPQGLRDSFLINMRSAFPDVTPVNPMMTWDDVRQLHAAGFVIGSHTKSHPVLSTLINKADIEAELRLSAERIRDILGEFPVSIAYPFGAFNKKVTAAAHMTGYRHGVTSNQQWYFSDRDDPFAISRTSLSNESWLKMRSRMNGSFERIKELVKGKDYRWNHLMLAGNIAASTGQITAGFLETLA